MSLDASTRLRDARRAYEIGRAKRSATSAAIVGPAILGSIWLRGLEPITLAAGIVLYALVAGLLFAGRGHARAAWAGLAAGALPLVMPLAVHAFGGECSLEMHAAHAISASMACCSSTRCMVACISAGLFAGMVVGTAIPRDAKRAHLLAGEAALVAILAGVLGCALMGLAGIVGMAGATIASAAAARLLVPLRSR